MTNSVNLQQTDGGNIIKQGDVASSFTFKLLDENLDTLNLDGKKATIYLLRRRNNAIHYQNTVIVEENQVTFTLDKPLDVGIYDVEIHCEGYVFPSDNSVKLDVRRSGKHYVSATDIVAITTTGELADAIDKLNIELSGRLQSTEASVESLKAEKESYATLVTDAEQRLQTLIDERIKGNTDNIEAFKEEVYNTISELFNSEMMNTRATLDDIYGRIEAIKKQIGSLGNGD